MKASELLKLLKASGTGASKIEAAGEWLKANRGDAARLLDAMERAALWPEGTVKKAKDFIDPPKDEDEPDALDAPDEAEGEGEAAPEPKAKAAPKTKAKAPAGE